MAFSAAAGISLFFTLPRLIRAINGGDGAPDLWETAGNAGINAAGDSSLFYFHFNLIRCIWIFHVFAAKVSFELSCF